MEAPHTLSPQSDPPELTEKNARNIMIGCVILYSLANLGGWIAPQLMFGAMQRYGIGAAEAGLIPLAEALTAGLLSMLVGGLAPRISYRRMAVLSLIVWVCTNLASPYAPNYIILLPLRFACGCADAILIVVSVGLIASTSHNPDRGYAMINIASALFGAAVLAILPLVDTHANGLSYFTVGALTSLILIPAVTLIPGYLRPGDVSIGDHTALHQERDQNRGKVFAILLTFFIASAIQSFSMFSFSPALGERLALSQASINYTFSAATLISISGPMMSAFAANRFGRWWPLTLATVAMFGWNMALLLTRNPHIFPFALPFNLTAAYAIIPLIVAWCAQIDPTGRYSGIATGAIAVVASISPSLAGLVVDHAGLDGLRPLVIGCALLMLAMLALLKMRTHSTAP